MSHTLLHGLLADLHQVLKQQIEVQVLQLQLASTTIAHYHTDVFDH